jgi:hypothetical protein
MKVHEVHGSMERRAARAQAAWGVARVAGSGVLGVAGSGVVGAGGVVAFVVGAAVVGLGVAAAGCGRTCNEVAADTQATLEALASGCSVDDDCRLARPSEVLGASVCALPCDAMAVRASVTDDEVRARLRDDVEDFEGCTCTIRARCAPASVQRARCSGEGACFVGTTTTPSE